MEISKCNTSKFLSKRNLILTENELFQPPPFIQSHSIFSKLIILLRRILDLQALSIWIDLTKVLPMFSGNIIDIGCGAQPYRELFRSEINYVGLDIIDSDKKFKYDIKDIIYIKSDGSFPLTDQYANFALCSEVLEHISNPQKFLLELKRCLKPNASICLTTPFSARWHYIPYDYWRFTPSSLKILLTEIGFKNVYIYARGNPLTVVCYKFNSIILPFILQQSNIAFFY